MAYSTQRAVSDGTLEYLDLAIGYQSRADVKVFFNDLPADPASWSWGGVTDKRIAFTDPVPNGVEVLVQRTTRLDRIINVFARGAKFNNTTMDLNFEQVLFLTQEAIEGSALSDIFNDVDFHGYRLRNIGFATDPTDAVSLAQYQADVLGAGVARDQAVAAAIAADADQVTVAADKAIVIAARDTTVAAAASVGTGVADAQAAAAAALGYRNTAGTHATNAAASAATALTAKTDAETARDAAVAATATKVDRTSTTGSAVLPKGTTAQRDGSPVKGYIRYNDTLDSFEGYGPGGWGTIGGGATGGIAAGVPNKVFYLNDQTVTANFTLPAGQNAVSAGPITIADTVEVTISDGSEWTVV